MAAVALVRFYANIASLILGCTALIVPSHSQAIQLPMSCELRRLAVAYAQDILKDRDGIQDVSAALAMDECGTLYDTDTAHRMGHRQLRSKDERWPGSTTTEFFVSPSGDDSNPGTKENPFLTIERAQEAVRALPPPPERPATTVWLREATYYLTKPLLFNSKDSGSEGTSLLSGMPTLNFSTIV